ncbi:NifU family protein [Phaeocystidibacter luteus]|uniref:NifU family protein n=1 Tax=Phaeocystidibacter luteus TaxID=911197 RepID=A0A6N6RJ58_9FLAO|nr:NifU family protein [Phaeocystidibacter luteus]KAB2813618.1 NifU family protein [Phaeocystidibacter luteus]
MSTQKVPVEIYAEMTPNPAVMKFVANRRLIEGDSVEFHNIEEAKPSPLASQLFHFPFVKEVFVSTNFVAISKFDIIEWDEVIHEIRGFISEYVRDGKPIMTAPVEIKETAQETLSNITEDINPADMGEVETRIVEILEEYVKPAVAQDGGNIRYAGYDNKIVKVQLQGACSGCPSSTMTLKNGILNLMQKMLPTLVDDVEAING